MLYLQGNILDPTVSTLSAPLVTQVFGEVRPGRGGLVDPRCRRFPDFVFFLYSTRWQLASDREGGP